MKRLTKDLIQQNRINVFACVDPKSSIYYALSFIDIKKEIALAGMSPIKNVDQKIKEQHIMQIYYPYSNQEAL